MNADAFRHFFEYHFAENHKVWDAAAQLSHEQFVQPEGYSHGSVRDQIVHLMNAEDLWFSELLNIEPLEPLPPSTINDRTAVRAYGDQIEQKSRAYLAALRDDMLFNTPIKEPDEDQSLLVWQVLLHVVNHGTDHRAQLLRLLHELGVETGYQDYIFYVYDHPVGKSQE